MASVAESKLALRARCASLRPKISVACEKADVWTSAKVGRIAEEFEPILPFDADIPWSLVWRHGKLVQQAEVLIDAGVVDRAFFGDDLECLF